MRSRPLAGLRSALLAAGAWTLLAAAALGATLHSLAHQDFDGTNNIFQLPLSLPWLFLLPYPGTQVAHAWVLFGGGLINAVLLFGAVLAASSRRQRAGH